MSITRQGVYAQQKGSPLKIPCRVATTGNVASLSGLLTIDTITVSIGDRVLVWQQGTPAENNIYIASSGAWTVATDMSLADDILLGMKVFVYDGSAYLKKNFTLSAISPVTFEQDTSSGLTAVVDDTTPQLGGELDAQAHSIGFTQQTVSFNAVTTTIDWKLGNKAEVTATDNIGTMAFTNPSKPCNLLLKFIHSGAGRTVTTWDTDIKWVGAAPPTLSSTSGNIDIISFYFDGTNFYGMASLNFA